jgi:hypothetical protein
MKGANGRESVANHLPLVVGKSLNWGLSAREDAELELLTAAVRQRLAAGLGEFLPQI